MAAFAVPGFAGAAAPLVVDAAGPAVTGRAAPAVVSGARAEAVVAAADVAVAVPAAIEGAGLAVDTCAAFSAAASLERRLPALNASTPTSAKIATPATAEATIAATFAGFGGGGAPLPPSEELVAAPVVSRATTPAGCVEATEAGVAPCPCSTRTIRSAEVRVAIEPHSESAIASSPTSANRRAALFFDATEHDALERHRSVGSQLRQRARGVLQDLHEEIGDRLGVEREAPPSRAPAE